MRIEIALCEIAAGQFLHSPESPFELGICRSKRAFRIDPVGPHKIDGREQKIAGFFLDFVEISVILLPIVAPALMIMVSTVSPSEKG